MGCKKTCAQCGGLLQGYYEFNCCSACYSANNTAAHIKKTRPYDTTHKMRIPDSLEVVYYKCVDGQWYIWSRIEKEPMHWLKTYVSENLLVPIDQ